MQANAQPTPKSASLRIRPVVAVAVALTLLWMMVLLARSGFDPKTFIGIGSKFEQHDPAGTTGYDGQFAYYIALHGLAAQPELDLPSYRLQRILYPLIVSVLALGQSAVIPWMLIVVNLVASAVCVGWLAVGLTHYRRSAWYALIFALWIGVIFTIRLDLNELTCVMFAIIGLVMLRAKRLVPSAILLGLSMLAKDMGIVFVAAAALHLFFSGQRRQAILVGIGALLPYALWALIVHGLVETPAIIYGGTPPPVLPLQGYANAKTPTELVIMSIFLIIPAIVLAIMAVRTLRRRRDSIPSWFMLAASIWVMYMPAASAFDLVAAFRVAMPLIPAGLIFAAGKRNPWVLYVLAALWAPSVIIALILPGFLG